MNIRESPGLAFPRRGRASSRALICACFLALSVSGAFAVEDSDEAALELADKTQTETSRASDWRILTEGALVQTRLRADGSTERAQRLSLDTYYDARLAPTWRFVFSDRLDLAWRGEPSYDDFINTLKETYVSWQPRADSIADLGRINLRYGVATAYNPTDYFRFGAVRSVVSVAPASLRENRLGTVMVRGQRLWSTGSLSALYAPEITDTSNTSPFSPDFGATNNQNRWLLAMSQKLGQDLNPQFLLYGEEHDAPQIGLNLTTLVNDATVAYVEWSGGRSPSLIAQALAQPDDSRFRSRAAAGATYTAPSKLSLTLEYEYNGAAPDEAQWNALRAGSPVAYARYRTFVQNLQDLPTRRNLFVYGLWQDALLLHLDLSAFQRYDAIDSSRLTFAEARYHWRHVDLALQWQHNYGAAGTQFGALPQEQVWQTILTYFF